MFKIEFNDLKRIIQAFGFDEFTAEVVADYLDECIDYDLDLSFYIWNTLQFDVKVFKTTAAALKYVKESLHDNLDNCFLWEGNFGVYLEEY